MEIARTVVTIAHELRAVCGADAVAVMSGGRIVERGTHVELMHAQGLYRRLFDLETATRPAVERP